MTRYLVHVDLLVPEAHGPFVSLEDAERAAERIRDELAAWGHVRRVVESVRVEERWTV